MTGIGWTRTRTINIAASLFTCGVHVSPISAYNEITGERINEFHIRDHGHLPAAVIPETDPHQVRRRFNLFHGEQKEMHIVSGAVKHALESGGMEQADPSHPALDVLRSLDAAECILSFMKRGRRYRIQLHPTAARARYVEGQEPLVSRMNQPGFETWETNNLAIAAAFVRIGCPVLDIRGTDRNHLFILPRFGYTLPGRFSAEDAVEIVKALRSGELEKQCPEHPVVWGYYGRKARQMLLDATEGAGPAKQVLQYHRRSIAWNKRRRCVLVAENASSAAFDAADRFIKG